MPAPMIKSFAKESGKTEAEVEELYYKAKDIAKEANHEEDYAYITGILKKMLSLNENRIKSFRELFEENYNVR